MAIEEPPDLEQGGQTLPAMTGEHGDQREDREESEKAKLEIRAATQEAVKCPEMLRYGHSCQQNAGQSEKETAGDESKTGDTLRVSGGRLTWLAR